MASLAEELVKGALPELFVERGVVAADQVFKRRLAEYEMNLEQQKLLREDLRDLVELTVGRMDVYHLVGAMLLEFCISFYCENKMAGMEEDEMPQWVLSFFLISNLGAAGYLIFAVWLSMHASVASHSIGVRLLTRFARLSIPSREELEAVAQAPLMPMMDRFLALGKRLGITKDAPKAASQAASAPWSPQSRATRSKTPQTSTSPSRVTRSKTPQTSTSPSRRGCGGVARDAVPEASAAMRAATEAEVSMRAIDEGARVQGDRSLHFRRFLQEQKRWLNYDAYARVCMSLGMNQMLVALSYYTIGVYVDKNPRASLITLFGLQWLALLLLRLDVVPGEKPVRELIGAVIMVPVPPLYIGGLIAVLRYLAVADHMLGFFATPAFVLHAAWLFKIAFVLTPGRDESDSIPKQLRTVLYLDVLHLEQDEVAEGVREEQIRNLGEEVRIPRKALQAAMRIIMAQEREDGAISTATRNAPELKELEGQLRDAIQEAGVEAGRPTHDLRTQIKLGNRTLEHFSVWQKAPELHHSLVMLRSDRVQGWLTEDQRRLVEQSYQAFLERCRDLDLGLLAGANLLEAAPSDSEGSGLPLIALPIAPGEEPVVKVEAGPSPDGSPMSNVVYLDPHSDRVQYDPPDVGSSTGFQEVVHGELPRWTRDAEATRRARAMRTMTPMTTSGDNPSLDGGRAAGERENFISYSSDRTTTPFSRRGGRMPTMATICGPYSTRQVDPSTLPLMPRWATPPERLPGVTVRRFTWGLGVLWLIAGATHLIENIIRQKASDPKLAPSRLSVSWPEPAALFDVASIHCNSSVVLVHNRFTFYGASRLSVGRLGPFKEVSPSVEETADLVYPRPIAATCDAAGCNALLPPHDPGPAWTLAHFSAPWGGRPANSALDLPASWRAVAMAKAPCDGDGCHALALAGWDGQEVTVANATRSDHFAWQGAWDLRPRFALRPGRGKCLGKRPKCADVETPYADVRAMQFGRGGRSLLVLTGDGRIDSWDLAAGGQLGSWRLPGEPAPQAMCNDGEALLFVRPGSGGAAPVLERAAFPRDIGLEDEDCGQVSRKTAQAMSSGEESSEESDEDIVIA